jgi:hypothetical protein
MKPVTLSDLPLTRLRRMLRDAERLAGPQSQSAAVIRRALTAKRREAASLREGRHG